MKRYEMVFIVFLTVALMVSSVVPAAAVSYPRTMSLETRDTSLQLDQWALRLNQPLVWVGGQPYAPVMELASFLGVQVTFDAREGWLQIATEGLLQDPGVAPWAGELARTTYEAAGLEQVQRELEDALDTRSTRTPSSTDTLVEAYTQLAAVTVYPLKLSVDGVTFHSREKMFLWQNTLYLPLYELADALYLTVTLEEETNALKLGSNPAVQGHNFPTLLLQLENARQQVAALQQQVTELEERLGAMGLGESYWTYEPDISGIPYRRITSVSSMERYLEDYYSSLEGVPAWMSLRRLSGNEYRLYVYYDAGDFDWFDAISRHRIESWVYDMQAAIRDLYDEDARVEGRIRSTPYDADEFTRITFEPLYQDEDGLFPELDFDFDEHGGSSERQLVDVAEVQRHLRRYVRRFDGLTFTYDAELIRRDVELTVITSESQFTRLPLNAKGEYLQELGDELEDLYPGIRVDGFITNARNDAPFYRFSLEKGEIRSYSLMDDLARELNREESRYGDLRFAFRVREEEEGSVLVKLEGDFASGDEVWQEENMADFTLWAEDLFQWSAEVLGRHVTGQVTDRLNETLLVRRINE